MNVFELAHQENDRLNDGDKGKFPITLIVVSEFLYILKPIDYFGCITYMVSCGDTDRYIIGLIHIYNAEYGATDDLGAMIEFQNSTRLANQYVRGEVSKILRLVKIFGSSILLGSVIGYMILS